MKPVLQVFAFDFSAKILLGVAGLALIYFLTPEEYAVVKAGLSHEKDADA